MEMTCGGLLLIGNAQLFTYFDYGFTSGIEFDYIILCYTIHS